MLQLVVKCTPHDVADASRKQEPSNVRREIRGQDSDAPEDSSLLGYEALSLGKHSPAFRTVVVSSFFRVKQSKNNTKPDETHRYCKPLPNPKLHESRPQYTNVNY